MNIELARKIYEVDESGYLIDFSIWDEHFPILCAKQDEIQLTDMHWTVIYFLRYYYIEYATTPWTRSERRFFVKKLTASWRLKRNIDLEKTIDSLFSHVPMGVVSVVGEDLGIADVCQDIRYAGLPKPCA